MRAATETLLGAAALCAVAGAARSAPVAYDCALSRDGATMALRFDIDTASFAPPVDPADPPRRQVSRVTPHGGARFEAEAMLTGDGGRGFWAPGPGWLLTRAPDGTARLSDDEEAPWVGRCEERP